MFSLSVMQSALIRELQPAHALNENVGSEKLFSLLARFCFVLQISNWSVC